MGKSYGKKEVNINIGFIMIILLISPILMFYFACTRVVILCMLGLIALGLMTVILNME